jgi:hypothetical protein
VEASLGALRASARRERRHRERSVSLVVSLSLVNILPRLVTVTTTGGCLLAAVVQHGCCWLPAGAEAKQLPVGPGQRAARV